MGESAVRQVLRRMVGAPSRPLRRAVSAPFNTGALKEWDAFRARFATEGLEALQRRLVRVSFDDARHSLDCSWRLPDKLYPYSCTEEEGLAIAYLVQANGLRRGFEIATAFGFSSAYIGLALKQTGGRLASIDCYVEEWKESFNYDDAEVLAATDEVRSAIAGGKPPSGLAFARETAALLGISEHLSFEVGMSPAEVGPLLGEQTLDFAFIDGGHFGEQPLRDFQAVEPHLEDRCVVLFHDNNHNPSVARAVAFAERRLGVRAVRVKTRFSLTALARNIEGDSVDRLRRIVAHNRLG